LKRGEGLKSEPIIAILIVNKIEILPTACIHSILEVTSNNIVIGYVNKDDVRSLPEDPRITYLDLKFEYSELVVDANSHNYISFENPEFFKLVKLKWKLFEKILSNFECSFLVYTDIDVLWVKNPISELEGAFERNLDIIAYVQDYTTQLSVPRLCMGFFAIKNCLESQNFIKVCKNLHTEMARQNIYVGDDDVITEYYSHHESKLIGLLPQTSFPVGNLLKAFSKRDVFPGLRLDAPYIFHANFVIGNFKKILILNLFSSFIGKKLLGINVLTHVYFRYLVFLKLKYNFLRNLLTK
jgi:hypothetical protein